MQTILGASGQIAQELIKELYSNYTQELRLVSRNPKKIHPTDQLFPANMLNPDEADQAIAGSEVVYFVVGLPANSDMWEEQFPIMMHNTIEACKKHNCKLVFFDNTYMYAKDSTPQVEDSPFMPVGRKSVARAKTTSLLLQEMQKGTISAAICRAPEFYGPAHTQSITNALVFNKIKANQTVKIPVKEDVLRTLIWTPDASRAMAVIGNTPDAYNQTWHLPCDAPITYHDFMTKAQKIYGRSLKYSVTKMWMFQLASLFNKQVKELKELLPRYEVDNIFVSDKFKSRFPEFKITTFDEGIKMIKEEQARTTR